MSALLQVRDLAVEFSLPPQRAFGERRILRAVDGVSFDLAAGEVLGLVGESGCGKSTTARAIVQLVPPTSGSVTFEGRQLIGLRGRELHQSRRAIQMIFQDPYASLDPRMSVARIIAEPMHNFGIAHGAEARTKAIALMERVGLTPAQADRYPHEFSGGQRQRIGIARALAADPRVLLCDEPVSALDVSVQAQVINLLQELQRELDLALVFIAHDLAVVRHLADRVAVMYAGRIVEQASTDALFEHAHHPYTRTLLAAVPIPDPKLQRERLAATPAAGEPPSALTGWQGCAFAPRCPFADEQCRSQTPQLEVDDSDRRVACWHPHEQA